MTDAHFRLRQTIEFFNFWKTDINHCFAGLRSFEHLRQLVECLRADYHIDEGRAFNNSFPFLAGDATTYRDAHIRIMLFQRSPASQLMEYLLLCFFADRASIQQQYVSLFSRVHQDRASFCLSKSSILAESYSFIWQP